MAIDPIVIVAAARTPLGGFQGDFAALAAPQLGAVAIRAAVARAGLEPGQVDEVLMGNVLPAGIGQAPARQAALGAGLPVGVPCTTVSKVCGSGMQAAILAHDLLIAGSAEVIVAGGMESMSNAPYLLPKGRAGLRLGHGQVIDHMFFDGLEDAYNKDAAGGGRLMGSFAEECADRYGFGRAAQDEFAIASTTRAQRASADGSFAWEIAAVTVPGRHDDVVSLDRRQAGPGAAGANRRPRRPRPGTGPLHHRPGRRHAQALRQDRLERRPGRPLRNQRGLRRRRHGGHARSRPAP